MQIPKTLKLGGHVIKVVETSDYNLLRQAEGTFNLDSLEIRIREDLPQSRKESIFLHEVEEAIISLNNLYLGQHHKDFTRLVEFKYMVYKDNGFCFDEGHKEQKK